MAVKNVIVEALFRKCITDQNTGEFTIELITRLIKLIRKESADCLAIKRAKAKQERIPILFLLCRKKEKKNTAFDEVFFTHAYT